MKPYEYGERYYCVKVDESVSSDKEIYVHASETNVTNSGALELKGIEDCHMLIIASGLWHSLYAASTLDGSAVAVEHWVNEVTR